MAISNGGEIGGTGSKTIGGSSPSGGDIVGGYIRVSPIEVSTFTISTNVGILTQADFVLTGTYYEYYNTGLLLIQSASSTGYTASINETTSHGDLVFEVVFHPNRLYAWTDPTSITGETLYAWTAPAGTGLFYYDSQYNQIPITDQTLYTQTSTVDTSTRTFYLEDGTPISLYDIWIPGSVSTQSGSSINSATSDEISIHFID